MPRKPTFPPGHPLASEYIQKKYGSKQAGGEPHPVGLRSLGSTDTLEPLVGVSAPEFQPVEFQCFVSPAGMRLDKHGNMEFVVSVIGEHVDRALPLRHLAGQLFPLLGRFEVWPDYVDRLVDDAADLDRRFPRG